MPVVRVPGGLRDDDDLRTRTLFDLCLGRIFPIELHVGEVLGTSSHIHSIYIEPENVEAVETSG